MRSHSSSSLKNCDSFDGSKTFNFKVQSQIDNAILDRFEIVSLTENQGRLPFLPLLKVPYYILIAKKQPDFRH